MKKIQDILNQSSISNNQVNTGHDLTNTVDITSQFVNWIIGNNLVEDSKIKNAILNNSHELEEYILEYIHTHQALTSWQEWEIHKIEIWEKKFIVAKKRYDTKSKHEYLMHQEAYKLMLLTDSNIKVPEILHEFENWENWYLLMEYIEWKTLYHLIWEEIINSHLISQIKKHCAKWSSADINALDDINKLYDSYWVNNKLTFQDDKEVISAMESLCTIMYDLWIIDWTFHKTVTEQWNPIKVFPIEEMLIKKYLGKISIFKEERYHDIIQNLNKFITEMHSKWFYHRDLWKNFRNIMFTDNDTYIIDFWRSLDKQNDAYDYEWIYTRDESIIHNINTTNIKVVEEDTEIINEDEIIERWNSLWLNINSWLIEVNKSVVKNINIINIFNDFISGNDRKYNWFIYLKSKSWSYEEKTTNIWKNKLFTVIQLLSKDNKDKIQDAINLNLQERKNTKKYKYAELFNQYLNA